MIGLGALIKRAPPAPRVRLRPGTALGALVKAFNPDQDRDDHGRWSAGAGGGPAELDREHLSRLTPEAGAKLTAMYREADKLKPAFDEQMGEIAKAVGGRAKLPSKLKGSDRATEKIASDYAGDASQIKDLLRGTIVVDSVASAQGALERIRGKFEVLPTGFRNTLDPKAPTKDGYRDIKMNVRVGGITAEIQINVPQMLAAKSANHGLYEQQRSIAGKIRVEGRDATPSESVHLESLNAQMKSAYDAAFATVTKP